jgi:hypothetical protein
VEIHFSGLSSFRAADLYLPPVGEPAENPPYSVAKRSQTQKP